MDIDTDSESDNQSVVSDLGYSETGISQSSVTSYERRSGSPVSVISLTDSMQAHIYRQEYGRNLNNYSDVYRLPADDEELDRLGSS